MSQKKYRIKNWSDYNKALKNRGSLTIWIEEGFESTWYAEQLPIKKRGRPLLYSDICIKLLATLRHIYKLALRQLEGFVNSLFNLLKITLEIPEFSRLSRRLTGLCPISYPVPDQPIHISIDSTGLKCYGEQEWIRRKQRADYKRRVWRKLHIAVDGSGIIRASQMTTHKTDDRSCFSSLMGSTGSDYINEVLADSGYDSHKSYHDCDSRNIKAIIPPPKESKPSVKKGASPHRNETISYINSKGIHAWKNKNRYERRNRVENTFFRIKTIFGRQLLSRTWNNQELETNMICELLNKITNLGMPQAVKA